MRKMLIAALAGALVALAVGALTGAGASSDDGTTTVETVTETVEAPKQKEAGEDVSGPCDEAEHANDPRCTGTPPAGGAPVDDDDDVQAPAPAPAPRVDNSGPGSMNSGPGSVNSGRDHAEDDDGDEVEVEVEDHSGPGHDGSDDHGGDDDNSGPGGGDDD